MMNPLNAANQIVWVAVLESKGARVLAVRGRHSPLELIKEWKNPEGRRRIGEIDSERPGRRRVSMHGSKYGLSPQIDSHQQKNLIFIHHIAQFLKLNYDEKKFQHLVLVAPPSLLGKLRGDFSDRMKQTIWKEIPKDLPFQKPKSEVEAYLRNVLELSKP